MNYVRIGLFVLIGLLVALLAGFLWGRAGLSTSRTDLNDTRLRLHLSQSRSDLLAARVDLFEVNFGRASQHLQTARGHLQDAENELNGQGRSDEAARAKAIASRVAQAQDQVGRLDQSANTRIGEAVTLLEQIATSGK
jgi:hypothetical protein